MAARVRRLCGPMTTTEALAKARRRYDQVEDAIESAVTAASESKTGRTIERQTLSDLRAERSRLVRQIDYLQRLVAGNPATPFKIGELR